MLVFVNDGMCWRLPTSASVTTPGLVFEKVVLHSFARPASSLKDGRGVLPERPSIGGGRHSVGNVGAAEKADEKLSRKGQQERSAKNTR